MRAVPATVVVAIFVVAAVVAPRAFDGDDSRSRPVDRAETPPQPSRGGEPLRDDVVALSVLRRPRRAGDALPPELAELISADASAQRRWAPRLAASRRLPTSGHAAWVVPGRGHTCLAIGAEGKFALDCETTRRTLAGHLRTVVDDPVRRTLTGLVPEGAGSVVVRMASGSTRRLPVRDNAYATVLDDDPVQLRFVTRGRARAVSLRPRAPRPSR